MVNIIKVLLVEDDPYWNECLAEYIQREADIRLMGTAKTKEEAIQIAKVIDLDVILMDVNLTENNLDGIDAVLEISSFNDQLKIIMLTNLMANSIVYEAFKVGAMNYIEKTSYREIPDSIRSAYYNRSAIHPKAAEILRHELTKMKQEELRNLLTSAEKGILELIDQGNTQKQISQKIHVAERTVKNHINHILKKLGVKSSKDAAEIAKNRKLI